MTGHPIGILAFETTQGVVNRLLMAAN